MRDFPPILLRVLGVVLIVLGISGIFVGVYVLKVVYEYNLRSPSGDVSEAISDISAIQKKLEKDRGRIENAINKTALSLKESSKSAEASGVELNSTGLQKLGEDLDEASSNVQLLNSAIGGVISDISTPLNDALESFQLIVDMASSIKAIAYALIAYIIVVHLLILGIGVALLVIEANLFYYE